MDRWRARCDWKTPDLHRLRAIIEVLHRAKQFLLSKLCEQWLVRTRQQLLDSMKPVFQGCHSDRTGHRVPLLPVCRWQSICWRACHVQMNVGRLWPLSSAAPAVRRIPVTPEWRIDVVCHWCCLVVSGCVGMALNRSVTQFFSAESNLQSMTSVAIIYLWQPWLNPSHECLIEFTGNSA